MALRQRAVMASINPFEGPRLSGKKLGKKLGPAGMPPWNEVRTSEDRRLAARCNGLSRYTLARSSGLVIRRSSVCPRRLRIIGAEAG